MALKFDLPSLIGHANQVLTVDPTESFVYWGPGGTVGGVTSFNGRTGAITLTTSDVTGALGYTPLQNITGLVSAGSNITIAGSGTNASPYVINGTAGGVTSFNTRTGAVTLTSGDVTTALGFTPVPMGGLNAQLLYNNSGAIGSVSGATTNGTIVSLASPLIGSATITTSTVNGVTLTTGGSTSSFLNASGAYSTPVTGVSSVSNSDGTLTISPTTGAVVASLALGHANSWTGQQTFGTSSPIFSTMTANSVLFAGASGILSQNNNNFYFQNSSTTPTVLAANTNVALSVNTGGDFTGTDSINNYGVYDSYLPFSAITNSLAGLNTDGAVPIYGVSSSAGTGTSPIQLATGSLVGGFFGFGAQGASSPTYQNLGGMAVSTVGTSTNNLGGQLNWYTKGDGGSLASHLSLDSTGMLATTAVSPEYRLITSSDSMYARWNRVTTSDTLTGYNNVLRAGGVGSALFFNDPMSQYYNAADTGLPSGSSAISVSFWIFNPVAINQYMTAYSVGAPTGSNSLGITVFSPSTPATASVYVNTNLTSGSIVAAVGSMPTNQWNHVVMTYAGGAAGAMKVYVNNSLVSTSSQTLTVSLTGFLANYLSPGIPYFAQGGVDQLLVYNTAITAIDVGTIWAGGAGTLAIPTTGLIRRYEFEEGSGSTVHDTNPGTKYDMTLFNSPTWSLNGWVPVSASSTETPYYTVSDGLTNTERGVAAWGDVLGRNVQNGRWFQFFQNNLYPLVSNNSGQWLFNPARSSSGVPTVASTVDFAGNMTIGSTYAGTNAAPTNGLLVQGQVGLGVTTVTAQLHLKAGTATAGTAPFKLSSGVSLTTPELGSVEYNGTSIFFTPTGTIRKVIPTIIDSRSVAQTAAVASVATQTVGSADASYLISSNVLVTASVTHSFTVTVAYTDEGNTARTLTLSFSQLTGTFLTAITNVQGTGAYEGIPLHIRCKSATTITMATVGTFTSVTYNVEGAIAQIS